MAVELLVVLAVELLVVLAPELLLELALELLVQLPVELLAHCHRPPSQIKEIPRYRYCSKYWSPLFCSTNLS